MLNKAYIHCKQTYLKQADCMILKYKSRLKHLFVKYKYKLNLKIEDDLKHV